VLRGRPHQRLHGLGSLLCKLAELHKHKRDESTTPTQNLCMVAEACA
jgi:hypothetical protein